MKIILLTCFVCFVLGIRVDAQESGIGHLGEVPLHGEVRGIASFHDYQRRFLAVWYYVKGPRQGPSGEDLLIMFEQKQDKYKEVFRHESKPPDGTWERILPLYPGRLTGLVLSASEISGDDDQWLIALVNNEFKVVHHGAGTSEFLDINDDGYPEIFDSMWPDGDGIPKTTRVLTWDGSGYQFVIEVKYNARLSTPVRNAVNKASRRYKKKIVT